MRPILFTLIVLIMPTTVWAQNNAIVPSQTWTGSVADDSLAAKVPTVVVSQATLDALWKSWKQPKAVPNIDFTKNIAVLVTSRGSVLNLNVEKNDADLKVFGFGTQDFRPGFRFVIGSVPRAGIATINGVPLPKK